MALVKKVGNGKVVLLAGGGKCYTDIAARFCHSERSLEDIIISPYNKKLVQNILGSGHLAASEFDYFLFGIEGYARVTEVQLVRKRLASYLISSGRDNRNGKRSFDIVLPEDIMELNSVIKINPARLFYDRECTQGFRMKENKNLYLKFDTDFILAMIENWYDAGVEKGLPEEDLRYMKPQGTAFKAIIGMNAHALLDWFKIRTCMNAQTEIRDLATKMMNLCKEKSPDLFENAGPSCKVLGYCPEDARQNPACNVIKKSSALRILKEAQNLANDLKENKQDIVDTVH